MRSLKPPQSEKSTPSRWKLGLGLTRPILSLFTLRLDTLIQTEMVPLTSWELNSGAKRITFSTKYQKGEA